MDLNALKFYRYFRVICGMPRTVRILKEMILAVVIATAMAPWATRIRKDGTGMVVVSLHILDSRRMFKTEQQYF